MQVPHPHTCCVDTFTPSPHPTKKKNTGEFNVSEGLTHSFHLQGDALRKGLTGLIRENACIQKVECPNDLYLIFAAIITNCVIPAMLMESNYWRMSASKYCVLKKMWKIFGCSCSTF